MKRPNPTIAASFLALCLLTLASAPGAVTLTVTNNGDAAGASTCTGGAACSLRQAISRANGDVLSDTIEFAIPGAGPHFISPATPLPTITNLVSINGYSQPGAVENSSPLGFNAVLKIQLSGAAMAQDSVGLRVSSALGGSIRGLSITGFDGPLGRAIEANSGGQVTIRGCALGVTVISTAVGNQIAIEATPNHTGGLTIGGSGATALTGRNLISGNVGNGILLRAVSGSAGTVNVLNNLIGTAPNGDTTMPNGGNGITLSRSPSFIRDNTIRGNNIGVLILGTSDFTLTGNRIGVGATGSIGGNSIGISLQSATGTGVIGGSGLLANTIAGSTFDGIAHSATGLNVDFSLNRFFENGQLGIDLLGNNGVTANDAGDADTGPNGLQNFPVITSATRTQVGGAVSLSGTLNALPNRAYRLNFYANPTADGGGHGEGQFIGDTTVDVVVGSGGGDATFGPITVNFNEGATAVNAVSATATMNNDDATSEFSLSVPIQLVAPVVFTVTSSADPGDGVCNATCTLREAVAAANGNGNAAAIDEIHFAIPGAGPHTIVLASSLPVLTQPVTIDGYTQPGALPNTDGSGVGSNAVLKIEIQAAAAATFAPFTTFSIAPNITLRGLALNRFVSSAFAGFAFIGNNTRVEGCWFGLRPDGSEVLTEMALSIEGIGDAFGGASPAQRNIWINRDSMRLDEGHVTNNLFGVLPGGRAAAVVSQSQLDGAVSSSGAATIVNNVFSTKLGSQAIRSIGANLIQDNAFGESFDGATVLSLGTAVDVLAPNVRIESATRRIRNPLNSAIAIRSTSGSGVVIVNQAIVGGQGRGIEFPDDNEDVLSLSVRSSIQTAGLGIDLNSNGSPAGVTPNDLGDADTGPNDLQNFPVLSSAVRSGSTITVIGNLNSRPSQSYRILLCGVVNAHPSGNGGCDEVLDDDQIVTTDANGNVGFNIDVAHNPAHQRITASAARILGPGVEQTSEFGSNIPITGVDAMFANGFE